MADNRGLIHRTDIAGDKGTTLVYRRHDRRSLVFAVVVTAAAAALAVGVVAIGHNEASQGDHSGATGQYVLAAMLFLLVLVCLWGTINLGLRPSQVTVDAGGLMARNWQASASYLSPKTSVAEAGDIESIRLRETRYRFRGRTSRVAMRTPQVYLNGRGSFPLEGLAIRVDSPAAVVRSQEQALDEICGILRLTGGYRRVRHARKPDRR